MWAWWFLETSWNIEDVQFVQGISFNFLPTQPLNVMCVRGLDTHAPCIWSPSMLTMLESLTSQASSLGCKWIPCHVWDESDKPPGEKCFRCQTSNNWMSWAYYAWFNTANWTQRKFRTVNISSYVSGEFKYSAGATWMFLGRIIIHTAIYCWEVVDMISMFAYRHFWAKIPTNGPTMIHCSQHFEKTAWQNFKDCVKRPGRRYEVSIGSFIISPWTNVIDCMLVYIGLGLGPSYSCITNNPSETIHPASIFFSPHSPIKRHGWQRWSIRMSPSSFPMWPTTWGFSTSAARVSDCRLLFFFWFPFDVENTISWVVFHCSFWKNGCPTHWRDQRPEELQAFWKKIICASSFLKNAAVVRFMFHHASSPSFSAGRLEVPNSAECKYSAVLSEGSTAYLVPSSAEHIGLSLSDDQLALPSFDAWDDGSFWHSLVKDN